MRYEEFEERLQRVLDSRSFPESDARLCELAEEDDEAAARLRAAELIASPPAMLAYPSADFADRILARIKAEDYAESLHRNAPIWTRRSSWLAVGMTVAASLLVAFGVWMNQPEADNSVVAPVIVAENEAVESNGSFDSEKSEQFVNNIPRSLEDVSKRLDVREEKVKQLREGLNPFRSTLNVTLHVLRSTVPDRQRMRSPKPVDGKPSTSILSSRWVV
jgi:hypothetical protein